MIFYGIISTAFIVNKKANKSVIALAITTFIKLRWNDALCGKKFSKQIFNYLNTIFDIQDDVDETEVQSADEILFNARFILDSCSSARNSAVFKKIYKAILYCMSMSIFDSIGMTFENCGYTKLQEAAMRKKFHSKLDFVTVLTDTLLFLLERGYQVYKTGDINTIFHCGGKYSEIFDTCERLKRQFLLLTNPEDHGFTESAFRADLNSVLEKLASIQRNSNLLDEYEKAGLRKYINEMKMMYDDLTTKTSARQTRKCPFSILIVGDSGIGKTTITEMLYQYFCKIHGLRSEPEYRYTRNAECDFWDGFSTEMHTIVLDDVAARKPNTTEDRSISEIIQIMNSAPFCPNQASLEQKGRTPLKAKFVIATTNVKTLNAYHAFTCPSAVQRRFPFVVTPTVKSEFLNSRGMLDSSKVDPNLSFPDLWTFKVEFVKPAPLASGRSLADFILIHDNLPLSDFLNWFREASRNFKIDQDKVFNSLHRMKEIELCRDCELPVDMCVHVQSGDTSVVLQTASAAVIMWYYLIHKLRLDALYAKIFNFCVWVAFFMKLLDTDPYEYIAMRTQRFREKEFWVQMGDKVKRKLNHPVAFTTAAGILTSGYFIYKFMKKVQVQTEDLNEVGRVPTADLKGRENVWYKNDITLTPFDISRESSSAKSMEFTSFTSKLEQNSIALILSLPHRVGYERPFKAFCVRGHIYMTNNHNIPLLERATSCRIIQSSGKDGVNQNMTITVCEEDVIRYPDMDIAFVVIKSLPPKKDFTRYFVKNSTNGVFDGSVVIRQADGSIKKLDVKNMRKSTVKLNEAEVSLDVELSAWEGHVSSATELGDCGSIYAVKSERGYMIAGIHVAYSAFYKKVICINVTSDFIDKALNEIDPLSVQSSSYEYLSSISAQRKVIDLHKKSVLRFIQNGRANIHGSLAGFRGKSKSRVTNTPMSSFLKDEGYNFKFTQPDMTSWAPWHIACKDMVQPVHDIDTSLLNKCVESYINEVTDSLIDPEHVSDMLHVLDTFTAINGAAGVSYIDKINRNTSAGNPWKKCKKFFMINTEPKHGMLDPVEVDIEIMDRVESMHKKYLNGECVHPNFCAHLKDEPVSFKKAKIGKTRVFTGAPFDWTILVRKFLLGFTRLLQNERLAFEAAPGTIAQSLEWHELYDHIVKFGDDRIIAGDYKAFDKSMSPVEILAAFDVIIHFCAMSGNYTQANIQVIRGIAEDTAFPLVDYNGDLIQFFGSNPSGHPLTVIINSIVNSLRMRYIFFKLNPEETNFKKNVSLMTYGDDNIMSVSRNCMNFNHTVIAAEFLKMNIVYTMADKEAESVPFVHISEASFLKRTWRYDSELKCYLAPLDHESIEKMLMTWSRSKSITASEQGIDVIGTALREYFYYGRSVFEEKRKMLGELIWKLKWEDYVQYNTLSSYEDLMTEFQRISRKNPLYREIFGEGSSSG
jgi:hypothetical protein